MSAECNHEPGPVTSFAWTCKHCDKPLEAVPCNACDGHGFHFSLRHIENCNACDGSGVKEWRLA